MKVAQKLWERLPYSLQMILRLFWYLALLFLIFMFYSVPDVDFRYWRI